MNMFRQTPRIVIQRRIFPPSIKIYNAEIYANYDPLAMLRILSSNYDS